MAKTQRILNEVVDASLDPVSESSDDEEDGNGDGMFDIFTHELVLQPKHAGLSLGGYPLAPKAKSESPQRPISIPSGVSPQPECSASGRPCARQQGTAVFHGPLTDESFHVIGIGNSDVLS